MIPEVPASLIDNLKMGRCVLFAGAGLSRWAGLPDWTTLLGKIVARLSQEDPGGPGYAELKLMIESGKLLEVAEYCKDRLGPLYKDTLVAELTVNNTDIPEPHRIIAELPFAAIVTTNYDKVIEQSFIRLGRAWPKSPTHKESEELSRLLFEGRFFVLKVHGDIYQGDTLILTTTDYRELIHANAAFSAMFSALLLTKAIFFVGYSLSDPDFRILLDRQLSIFRGNVPDRYALMSRVGPIQKDVLWRTARIRVLEYEEHSEILQILKRLRAAIIGREDQVDVSPKELFGS
jgi:hypothetical protein